VGRTKGHRVAASIAEDLLTPEARHEVTNLVGRHLRGDQGIQLRDGPVQVLHVRELLAEEGALARGECAP